MQELKKLGMGFVHAIRGLGYAIATQRNMRIHLVAVCVVVIIGIIAHLSPVHWCLAMLCCGLVIALELVNTALEEICNRITEQEDVLIRHAKDASAGAVLIAAIGSVIVAVMILRSDPIYLAYISSVISSGIRPKVGLVIDAVAAVLFIFVPSYGNRK